MKRIPKTRQIFDKLHHLVVWTCIGISAASFLSISYLGFQYYMYVKPVRKAAELKAKQELLDEGASMEVNVQELTS